LGPWREKSSVGCESVIGSLSKLMSLRDFAGGGEAAIESGESGSLERVEGMLTKSADDHATHNEIQL